MLSIKKFFWVYAWLLLATGVILSSAAALHFFFIDYELPTQTLAYQESEPENTPEPAFVAQQVKGVETVIEVEDGRAEVVANFLERHNADLIPYDHFGQVFVEIADRYGFDFRLLPAIAMQESNLCQKIPPNSFNCLGFGVHSRGTLAFDSYEANFDRAGRELKQNYIDQGRTTPEQIMQKYTPSSNGSWAESVNQWMAEMRYDDRQKGRELKTPGESVMEFAR
jgi:hypothetical protein